MGTVGYPSFDIVLRTRLAARQAFPEFAELLSKFGVIQISYAFARHNHNIPAVQNLLVQSVGFTNLAFEAIAFNGELDALLANHQTQTGVIEAVVTGEKQNVFTWNFAGGGVEDRLEVSGSQQALFPTEVSTHHPFRAYQTARRLRPLARRRDRTARPFLVAIRARKPWVRARLIVLGWKVRFMVRYLVVDYGPEWPPFKETGNSREAEASGQFPTRGFCRVRI